MAPRCTCPPYELANVECPKHGLVDGQKFPPMDRHALRGEDAKMAQERLYAVSKGLPVKRCCVYCKRVGVRGFEPDPARKVGFRCVAFRACEKRKPPLTIKQLQGKEPIRRADPVPPPLLGL